MTNYTTQESSSEAISFIWIGEYNKNKDDPRFMVLKGLENLPSKIKNIDAIVLNLPKDIQDTTLVNLRSSSLTALSCIYIINESPLSPHLSNGYFDTSTIEIKSSTYKIRKKAINLINSDDASYRLLSFLYLFPDYLLQPTAEPDNSDLYTYPLLKSFDEGTGKFKNLLDDLKSKKLLDSQELIDRVRQCKKCNSGHINYIDICPQCNSIDINIKSSLHCFNCGHVDCQEKFYKNGRIGCPNCLQQLRHIGVDYDRPIENQHCNSCNSLFVDSRVEARCLHCGCSHLPDELKVKKIESYSLSSLGRDYVQNGVLQSMLSSMGESMSRSQFLWLIQWCNQLALRHGHEHLILEVFIDSKNTKSEDESTLLKMNAIKERLLEIFRVTDACNTHNDQSTLIFLPFTEHCKIKPIKNKINKLNNIIDDTKKTLQLKVITLPDEHFTTEPETWLSMRLNKSEALTNE